MNQHILVAGSINMDIVVGVQKLPVRGETIAGSSIRYIPGGKGANQAVAASRLGGKVTFLGKVGSDDFGGKLHKYLRSEKLDTQSLSVSSTNSGIALITVDSTGRNTIVILSGSNAEVTPAYIEQYENLVKRSEVVITQFEIPHESVTKLLTLAKDIGKTTIINPAPARKIDTSLLKKVDYLVVNQPELAYYSGTHGEMKNMDKIIKTAKQLKEYVGKAVVVTLGPEGSVTITNDEVITTPGLKVKAVDTTAAGDCYVGALAVQIVQKVPLKKALEFANKAATISVTRWGASSSLPTLGEVMGYHNT